MAEATRTRMTAAEFALLPETTQSAELIDGEIVELTTPKHLHQKTVVRLIQMLTPVIPGGELCVAPMDVYLDEFNVPQPDVFWVAGPDSLCKLGEDDYWHGPPDLVIEVLSPSTSLRDRRETFLLYEKHGVREYWLVDPLAQTVEVWIMSGGRFQRQGIYGPDESFESPVLNGQKIDLSSLFTA